MKQRNLAWLVVVCAGFVGCKNTVRVRYDGQLEKMIPALKAGDVIEFNREIKWDLGQRPCTEKTDGMTCTIASGLKGDMYTYTCPKDFCDPEILIDENRVEQTAATGPRAANDTAVTIGCDATKAVQVHPIGSLSVIKGSTIRWRPVGDYSKNDWSLAFGAIANLCTDATEVNQAHPYCSVKPDATETYYRITINGCTTQSDQITITPR